MIVFMIDDYEYIANAKSMKDLYTLLHDRQVIVLLSNAGPRDRLVP